MAKAINWWFGADSYGRAVEVAQREDGAYFARHDYRDGRYGMRTTSWYAHTPTFNNTQRNHYTDEAESCDEFMSWGFNRLTKASELPKLRLPN